MNTLINNEECIKKLQQIFKLTYSLTDFLLCVASNLNLNNEEIVTVWGCAVLGQLLSRTPFQSRKKALCSARGLWSPISLDFQSACSCSLNCEVRTGVVTFLAMTIQPHKENRQRSSRVEIYVLSTSLHYKSWEPVVELTEFGTFQ